MVRFSSPATNDITMLDAHARALIEMMGHLPSGRGAIAAEDVPRALQNLRSAIAAYREPERVVPEGRDAEEEEREHVGLKRRAFPVIELLERAAGAKEPVLWDSR